MFLTAGTNLAATALGATNGLLLARLLGPTDRGLLASILQPVVMLSLFATLGVTEELVLRGRDQTFLAKSRNTLLLVSIAVAAICFVYAESKDLGTWISLAVASLPLTNCINQLFAADLRRDRSYGRWNRLSLVAACGPPAFFGALALVGYMGVAAAILASAIASTTVLLLGPARIVRESLRARRAGVLGFRQIRTSLEHLAVIAQTNLTASGDVLVLSLTGRNLVTGIYVVAVTASAPLTAIAGAITTQAFSEAAQGRLAYRHSRRIVVSAGGLIVAYLVVLQFAMPLFLGNEYQAAVVPAQILVIASVPAIYRRYVTSSLRATEHRTTAVRIELTTLVVTLGPFILLRNVVTPTSAALISLVGYTVGALLAWVRSGLVGDLRTRQHLSDIERLELIHLPTTNDADFQASRLKVSLARAMGSPPVGAVVAAITFNHIRNNGITFDTSDRMVSNGVKAKLAIGTYESSEIRMIRKYISGAQTVIELGSSLGFTGSHVLASMSIDGHLLCVEANPNLVPSLTERLHRHRKSQRIDVLQAAIAYDVDEVEFAIESENTAGRISPGSGVTVPAIEFGELITKFRIVGAYALVCDIEGAELMLVERDRSSLAKCELVVIELHESVDQLGRRVSVDQLRAKFVEIGFTMIEAHGPVCCLRRPVIDPNSPQTA